MKATALAHPNIALVKYWGKRDDALILPHQSSLSLTLAPLSVTTTVEFGVASDQVEINGHTAKGSERDRVLRVLEAVRAEAPGKLGPARMVSRGDFPAAAGLASSAAGFAALAVAARAAAGLKADAKVASMLSRLGS
ncbi:MAG TPA: diphosphomevalonate decarboxylase, partial [Longimicrobium sp.]|nr:diphosphomevalonate decarboxylase [Longimicrobium sp.]